MNSLLKSWLSISDRLPGRVNSYEIPWYHWILRWNPYVHCHTPMKSHYIPVEYPIKSLVSPLKSSCLDGFAPLYFSWSPVFTSSIPLNPLYTHCSLLNPIKAPFLDGRTTIFPANLFQISCEYHPLPGANGPLCPALPPCRARKGSALVELAGRCTAEGAKDGTGWIIYWYW